MGQTLANIFRYCRAASEPKPFRNRTDIQSSVRKLGGTPACTVLPTCRSMDSTSSWPKRVAEALRKTRCIMRHAAQPVVIALQAVSVIFASCSISVVLGSLLLGLCKTRASRLKQYRPARPADAFHTAEIPEAFPEAICKQKGCRITVKGGLDLGEHSRRESTLSDLHDHLTWVKMIEPHPICL